VAKNRRLNLSALSLSLFLFEREREEEREGREGRSHEGGRGREVWCLVPFALNLLSSKPPRNKGREKKRGEKMGR